MPTIKAAVDAVLAHSPAQWLLARRPADLAVLAYHGIDDASAFARQLDWIAQRRHPVSLDHAVDGLLGLTDLPPDAVLVTFDDGHRSVFEVGLPLLEERGIPGAVFVVADLIDTDDPFWWDEVAALSPRGRPAVDELKRQPDSVRRATLERLRDGAGDRVPRRPQLRAQELREAEARGLAVGNHSASHALLDRCDADVLSREVADSHERLTRVLGHPPRAFAYPNGDRSTAVVETVRAAGYGVGFLFDHRLTPVPAPEPLEVSRVRVDSTTTLDRFRTIVSGLHPALHHLRGRA